VLLVDWLEERTRHDGRDEGVLGWAWATVDLERALVEAGEHETDRWVPVADDLLGARGLRLVDVEPAVIVLEPSTEGRLAGWLARNGEGEAVRYYDPSYARSGVGDSTVASGRGVERPDELPGSTLLRMTALGRPGRIVTNGSQVRNAMPLEVVVSWIDPKN
jgi:hypothetical protein